MDLAKGKKTVTTSSILKHMTNGVIYGGSKKEYKLEQGKKKNYNMEKIMDLATIIYSILGDATRVAAAFKNFSDKL
jgi:hypothetical protein